MGRYYVPIYHVQIKWVSTTDSSLTIRAPCIISSPSLQHILHVLLHICRRCSHFTSETVISFQLLIDFSAWPGWLCVTYSVNNDDFLSYSFEYIGCAQEMARHIKMSLPEPIIAYKCENKWVYNVKGHRAKSELLIMSLISTKGCVAQALVNSC